ncbi:MAG: cytochrome c5, partial [Kiritimatiellia bacterium]
MRAWLCAVALMLAACDDEPAVDSDPGSETDTQSDTAASEPVSWNDDIWPILDANCHPCHDVRD